LSKIMIAIVFISVVGALFPPGAQAQQGDPWPAAAHGPMDAREDWPDSRPVGQLTIPKIELDEEIYAVHFHKIVVNGVEGVQPEVKPNNVGWQDHSSPALGTPGNTVLNGHHFENGTGVFRRLIELGENDAIAIENYVSGNTHYYKVDETLELLEVGAPVEERIAHAQYLAADTPDERVTTITCDGPHSEYRFLTISRPHEDARTIYEQQAN
jgi:sortase (surface protein transpeptidase)